MNDLRYCKPCFEKQQIINKLTVENERLRAQLRAQERSAKEGPFGSGTPSAKLPFKPNALSERQERRGGGKPGHSGHGRRRVEEEKRRTASRPSPWKRRPVQSAACRCEARGDGNAP